MVNLKLSNHMPISLEELQKKGQIKTIYHPTISLEELQKRGNIVRADSKLDTTVKTKKPGIISRLVQGAKNVFKETVKNVEEIADTYQKNKNLPATALSATAIAPKAIGDSIFEAAKVVAPDSWKQAVKQVIQNIVENPNVSNEIIKPLMEWSEKNPQKARAVKDVADIASVLPGPKAVEVTGKVIKKGEDAVVKTVAPIAESAVKKTAEKTAQQSTDIVDRIVRGSKNITAQDAKAALMELDGAKLSNVKTFKELSSTLDEHVKAKTGEVTKLLEQDPNVYNMENLIVSSKVGERSIETNYALEAVKHLEEFYQKTFNPTGLEKIAQLKKKMLGDGLTQVEINALAKEYGSKLTTGFYKQNGDLLKGANAQASESVRKGLKETSRSLYEVFNPGGAKKLQALDQSAGRALNTKAVIDKLSEMVRAASAKAPRQSSIRKAAGVAGKAVGTAIDYSTAGGIKAIVRQALGANFVRDTISLVDLEKALNKSLRDLVKNGSKETVKIKTLKAIIEASKKLP